jgi:ribosome-binding factor A
MKFLDALFNTKPEANAVQPKAIDPKMAEQIKQMQSRFRAQMAAQKQGRFSPELSMDRDESYDLDTRLLLALAAK